MANVGADALGRLLPVGNSGGFRYRMRGPAAALANCALIACTEDEPNWADHLDVETGRFTYYGDNRRPGHELHETPRGAIDCSDKLFDAVRSGNRSAVPPLFIFTTTGVWTRSSLSRSSSAGSTEPSGDGRSHRSLENRVGEPSTELQGRVHRPRRGRGARAWIVDLLARNPMSPNTPTVWADFVTSGVYRSLLAPRTLAHRTTAQQKPVTPIGVQIISLIHQHFANRPFDFEKCAVELASMLDSNVIDCDLTRPWRDGGRDAIGFLSDRPSKRSHSC